MEFDAAAFLQTFFEEAEEHLTAFEHGLLALEENPADGEVIAQVFRAAHSIKGASGTFGLGDVARFTHHLEGVLHQLRHGDRVYDHDLAELLLEALDVLKGLIAAARNGGDPPADEPRIRTRLEAMMATRSVPAAQNIVTKPEPSQRDLCVRVVTKPELLSSGMDPIILIRELSEAGESEVILDSSALPDLDELDPEACYLCWEVRIRTPRSDSDLTEIFGFVEGLCDVTVEPAPAPTEEAVAPEAAHESVKDASASNRTGQAQKPATKVSPQQGATVRVAAEKLDKLLDLVGELVIAQAMIVESIHAPSKERALRLQDALGAMERNTRELQEGVMSIRMVPLASVFGRLPRLVRDLGNSCGKPARLEIEGEDTEIDKATVEQLIDPLTHLVRNAIDHGLEAPEQREQVGKPKEGKLLIRAFHRGGNVVIEVCDDGKGLPTEAIRAKAVELGLVAPDANPTDEQIHDLVFHPGFSTAKKVSDVSGRGVGMDVVRRNVEALKGTVSLSTQRGAGTSVSMRFPLTLAILDGFAVRVADQNFILPLHSVVESFRPTSNQVRKILGSREVIDVRGVSLPLVRLHQVMGVDGAMDDPCHALISVIESNGASLAVLVDEVIGQMQVVVKSLELNYRRTEALMGATILGDGRVAMIVDVQALSRAARPADRSESFDLRRNDAQQENAWNS